jgi:hypothetical protein
MQRLKALSAAPHGADQTSGPDRGVERDVPWGARGPARRLWQWALVALGVITLMLVRGLNADEHTSLRVLRVAPSARWDGSALNRSARSRSGLPDDIAGRLNQAGRHGAFAGLAEALHTRESANARPTRAFAGLAEALHKRESANARTPRVANTLPLRVANTLPSRLAKTPPASVAMTLPRSVARTFPPSVAMPVRGKDAQEQMDAKRRTDAQGKMVKLLQQSSFGKKRTRNNRNFN